MRRLFCLAISAFCLFPLAAKAEFGDADFPVDMFVEGPKSYHDAWCRRIKNNCRVRFQGPAMWVEGQGGIQRGQLIRYRYDKSGGEFYNYITYKDKEGRARQALFLFSNFNGQREFMQAFVRWKKQQDLPVPNYLLPSSQGPQETHGRDKSYGRDNNPYSNPPVTDWKEKTTP